VLTAGQPLLFKLRAGHGGFIVGGGFFAHYTELPISLAWGAFGRKNGVPDLRAFRERIARLRREPADPWNEDPIGCILLAQPFFFDREDWIPGPADWAPNTQRGKGYDLSEGIGARLWADVRARLEAVRAGDRWRERAPDDDFPEPPDIPGGYAPTAPGRRRYGQGIFQSLILDAYGRQCAVTRERALPALDAAHIRSFSERPEHDVRNGLLLRSDVHRLFDAGYVTVTPQYKVEVSHRVREDFNDGENYLKMRGAEIVVPEREGWRPDREALAWHNERRFRG
jgi:putative restriction endonuclease